MDLWWLVTYDDIYESPQWQQILLTLLLGGKRTIAGMKPRKKPLDMGVEPTIGGKPPKMAGENNGKPYKNGMIWGAHPNFWKHPYCGVVNLRCRKCSTRDVAWQWISVHPRVAGPIAWQRNSRPSGSSHVIRRPTCDWTTCSNQKVGGCGSFLI